MMASDKEQVSRPRTSRGIQTIVCVDDDPEVLSALRRTFRWEPFEVVTISDASRAIEFLDQHSVQVVISDERMPGMAGSDLLAEVGRRWPWIGRVILTAFPGHPVMIRSLAAQVDFLIYKPWDDESFRRAVRRLVEEAERARSEPGGGPSREGGFDVGKEGE